MRRQERESSGAGHLMRELATAGLIAAGLGLAGGFGGALHPIGDSLAVLRPGLALLTLGLGALLWSRPGARFAAVLAVGVLLHYGWLRLPQPAPDTAAGTEVLVYQKNLLWGGGSGDALVADILSSGADFVTLQEVNDRQAELLEALEERYPHQFLCTGSIAVLSRVPLSDGHCARPHGLALATADLGGRRLRVGSIHLAWPYPWPQQSQVRGHLEQDFQGVRDGTLLLGGDFNMVPEGAALRWVAAATGAERIGHAPATFRVGPYPIAIDHVLATGGTGTVERRPKLGSDHHGLLARVLLPPEGDSPPGVGAAPLSDAGEGAPAGRPVAAERRPG